MRNSPLSTGFTDVANPAFAVPLSKDEVSCLMFMFVALSVCVSSRAIATVGTGEVERIAAVRSSAFNFTTGFLVTPVV